MLDRLESGQTTLASPSSHDVALLVLFEGASEQAIVDRAVDHEHGKELKRQG